VPFYAHTRGDDRSDWQTVLSHLTSTADLARSIGRDTGFADFAALAAMFHDLGKYSREFQARLEGSQQKVDHATAGAVEIERIMESHGKALLGRLLAYCIAGHHGGLPDAGTPADTADEATLTGRLKRPLKDYSAWQSEIAPHALNLPAPFPADFRLLREAPGFSLAFAVRMIYSILVDSDYLDTETFCNNGKKARGDYQPLESLSAIFFTHLRQFDHPTRPIDLRRNATLNACIQQASLPQGLFTLTLPTGAGKTLTSMAFAMQHALHHKLKRIIYVIPYTSIIEQNADVFRSALNNNGDHVLEHHSAFDWENGRTLEDPSGTGTALQKLRWAAENWDVPVIVTTNVQFFESLFASRNSPNRKVHNIAGSVVIFDEAQMLPREFMTPCITSVAELVRNYRVTAVFCTATQPALQRFFPADMPTRELIDDVQAEFDFYKRVQVQFTGSMTDEDLITAVTQHEQVLCIVNTRAHARTLFQMLPESEGNFHLSTLLCPAHRSKIIADIRQRLSVGLPCRVISTQLLEAGVDLDFPIGYGALGGLDSIIQAAGRVNREGKLPQGCLYVFEPAAEHAKRMPKTIQQAAEVTRSVLHQFSGADPISTRVVSAYYQQLYALQNPAFFDSHQIMNCFSGGTRLPAFQFATAAEKFHIIDDATVPVIVPYEPEIVERLILEFESSPSPLRVLRKLQPYTVNVFEKDYQGLLSVGAINLLVDRYPVLSSLGSYHSDIGLELADRQGGQGIYI